MEVIILSFLLLLSSSFPSPSSTTSTTTTSTINGGNETDMLSLVAFKNQLGSSSSALSSWNATIHFCGWIGVSCRSKKHPQRVTDLDLSYSSLAEYGKGRKVSTSGDVYSYGILLLEMFTGRRPVDHMFKDGYNLHEFVAMAYPNRIVDVIDPLLLLQNDGEDSNGQGEICWSSRRGVQECIASVVSVGISCSKESPRERTNMRAVAMELHAIRDAFIRQGV